MNHVFLRVRSQRPPTALIGHRSKNASKHLTRRQPGESNYVVNEDSSSHIDNKFSVFKDYTFRGFLPCPDPFLECQRFVNLAVHFITRRQPDTILQFDTAWLRIRLLLALMKWTARFTKRWHSKNGSGHGRNREMHNLYIESLDIEVSRILFSVFIYILGRKKYLMNIEIAHNMVGFMLLCVYKSVNKVFLK